MEIHKKYTILLAVGFKQFIIRQFESAGISNYVLYENDGRKYSGCRNDDRNFVMNSKSKMNHMLGEAVSRCDDFVPIDDYLLFRGLVKEYMTRLKGEYAFNDSVYNESIMYGHGKALMEYAGIDKLDYANFPFVRHGVFAAGRYPEFHSAVIYSGEWEKRFYNERYSYIPAFTVGPYIQYAKNIYSENKLREKRVKNGKTALIFLSHNTEKNHTTYDEESIIKKILCDYTKRYDTILVCAYWCDVNKDCYDILYKNGIQIVSAGFRWDERFIRRLRTLYELTDDVIVYGFSSAAIYALAMKKKLYIYDINEKLTMNGYGNLVKTTYLHETKEYAELTRILYENFGDNNEKLSSLEEKLLNDLFGFDIYRTPDEIRCYYDISCDIWNNCNHVVRDYPIGVYKTYQKYQDIYDFDKLTILSKALGDRFYHVS
jgi:hypothetical protein